MIQPQKGTKYTKIIIHILEYQIVMGVKVKFSKSLGYIREIPLNPPLQKGEAVGMPELIEKLPSKI